VGGLNKSVTKQQIRLRKLQHNKRNIYNNYIISITFEFIVATSIQQDYNYFS